MNAKMIRELMGRMDRRGWAMSYFAPGNIVDGHRSETVTVELEKRTVPTPEYRSHRFLIQAQVAPEEATIYTWLAQGGSLVAFGGPDRRCTVGEFEETLSAVLSTDDKVLLEALYRSGYQNYGWEE